MCPDLTLSNREEFIWSKLLFCSREYPYGIYTPLILLRLVSGEVFWLIVIHLHLVGRGGHGCWLSAILPPGTRWTAGGTVRFLYTYLSLCCPVGTLKDIQPFLGDFDCIFCRGVRGGVRGGGVHLHYWGVICK